MTITWIIKKVCRLFLCSDFIPSFSIMLGFYMLFRMSCKYATFSAIDRFLSRRYFPKALHQLLLMPWIFHRLSSHRLHDCQVCVRVCAFCSSYEFLWVENHFRTLSHVPWILHWASVISKFDDKTFIIASNSLLKIQRKILKITSKRINFLSFNIIRFLSFLFYVLFCF